MDEDVNPLTFKKLPARFVRGVITAASAAVVGVVVDRVCNELQNRFKWNALTRVIVQITIFIMVYVILDIIVKYIYRKGGHQSYRLIFINVFLGIQFGFWRNLQILFRDPNL